MQVIPDQKPFGIFDMTSSIPTTQKVHVNDPVLRAILVECMGQNFMKTNELTRLSYQTNNYLQYSKDSE